MVSRSDAVWTIAATLVSAICQLVQLSVAARHLGAHEFGALAIVNVMMTIVSGMQDMGLSSYCIHLGDVPRRTHCTLFWISTALGGFGMLLVLASALPLAWFYDIDSLAFLLPLLSLTFLIVGASAQYQANFIRVFQARKLAQIELAARLVGFSVTVGLLQWAAGGPEAIVIGLEIFWLMRLALMAALAPAAWHPRLAFDRGFAKQALAYGSYQTASQIVGQLGTQADQIILGKVLGPEALGFYSIAKDLVGYPLRVMQPVIARLTLPLLAHHQGDPAALRRAFITGLTRSAAMCALVFVPFALFAPWIVDMLYGPSFSVVATLLPLMTLHGMLRPVGLNAAMLAQATGRSPMEFHWNARASVVILLPNLLIALLAPSLISFAITLSVLQVLLSTLLYPWFVKPLEPIGMAAYLRTWIGPAVIAFAASALAASGLIQLPSLRDLLQAWLHHP